jgi:large subunit ribosomal protein L23
MALFSRTKKTVEAVEGVTTKVVTPTLARSTDRNLESILVKPLVTEKAVMQHDARVYTFIVAKRATKFSVSDAVTAIYKVTPVKVNIVNKVPRTALSRSRGRSVTKSGYKKAYVYLKKGDTINLV